MGIHSMKPLYDHLSYVTSVTNIDQKTLSNSTFRNNTHYNTTKALIM